MFEIGLKRRFGALAAAAMVASFVAVPSAFAQTYYDDTLDNSDIAAIPASSTSPNSRPTAAASRAAMPAAEILGLQGVEESGQLILKQLVNNSYYQPIYSWSTPKYMLFTSGYSAQPSPYLVNFAVHAGDMAAYNESRGGTAGNGPNKVLAAYGTGDDDDDAVWDMLPDIVIGNGNISDTALRALANPEDIEDGYEPVGVNYVVSHYADVIQTVEDIRDAAGDDAVTSAANSYIAYINDAANRVVREDSNEDGEIDDEEEVYVAWVKGYTPGTDATEDAEATEATFTIGSSYASNGTAAQNRYLETAEWAGAKNLNENTTADDAIVTASELERLADIIVVGGQQSGSGDFDTIMDGLYRAQLLDRTYFVNQNDMRAGSAYGVVMNSIENAQNIGRILQPITSIDQHDSLAYYFENYYHINHDDVEHVLSMSLNGYVRNWDVEANYNLSLEQNIANMTAW